MIALEPKTAMLYDIRGLKEGIRRLKRAHKADKRGQRWLKDGVEKEWGCQAADQEKWRVGEIVAGQ